MIASGNPSTQASTAVTTATTKVPSITVSTVSTVSMSATSTPASGERQQVRPMVKLDATKTLPPTTHSPASGEEVTNDDKNNTPSLSNGEHSNKLLLSDIVDHVHAHLSLELSHSNTINAHPETTHNRVRESLKNDDFSRKSNTFIARQQQQHHNYSGSNDINGEIKLIDENDMLLNESSQLLRNKRMKVTRFTRDTTSSRQITDYFDSREFSGPGNFTSPSIQQQQQQQQQQQPQLTAEEDDRNYPLNLQQMVHTNDENIYQQPVEKVTGNSNKRAKKTSRSKSNTSKANLIFILTDDQDVELGKYACTKNIFTHGAIS